MGVAGNRSLIFQAPRSVRIESRELPSPDHDQLLVQIVASAISAGTELLIYRGEAPRAGLLDESIPALGGGFQFPLRYGYAAAGRVVGVGASVDPSWLGRSVFLFHPHASYAVARPEDVLPLPSGLSIEQAVFIPNLETAVNLVMDGQPVIGERAVVFGQGVVGLLTTALLARFPLSSLITLDTIPMRRDYAEVFGARVSLDPRDADTPDDLKRLLSGDDDPSGADLAFELSGNPDALNTAIEVTGYAGRVVIGSWYGRKVAPIDLGGTFHRSRIRLISSQVSTIAPEFSGRWTKARRFEQVVRLLPSIDTSRLITHRVPIERAADAYDLLDREPGQALQILLTYDS